MIDSKQTNALGFSDSSNLIRFEDEASCKWFEGKYKYKNDSRHHCPSSFLRLRSWDSLGNGEIQ